MAGPWEQYQETPEAGPWAKYGTEEPQRRTPTSVEDKPHWTDTAGKIASAIYKYNPQFAGVHALQALDEASTEAGGRVTDIAARAGLPPQVAAGAGYAANVSLQALPTFAGGIGAKAAAPAMQHAGRWLMQSALKPTAKQLKSGDAAVAIDTMLERGWNATAGGVEQMKSEIDVLNKQITDAISTSGATVSKSSVGKRLLKTLEKFNNQVNPNADLKAIKNAWMEFRNHPLLRGVTDIPVQLAQKLKQGTYKQVAKKYGELSGADVEAQKTLARGLKEEIAQAVPGIAGLNKAESEMIKTLNVAERRALMELNKNPVSLGWLAHSPATFAMFVADRSAAFKSLLARMLYSGAEQIPATGARAGISLYEMSKGMNQ